MSLAIWEGPSHRQMLDGSEVMERKRAHHLLLQLLCANVPLSSAGAEALFAELAACLTPSLGCYLRSTVLWPG
jgi:hypothetical protein